MSTVQPYLECGPQPDNGKEWETWVKTSSRMGIKGFEDEAKVKTKTVFDKTESMFVKTKAVSDKTKAMFDVLGRGVAVFIYNVWGKG